MAVVLSARLMVRYADKYDPDLALGVREARRGPAAGARASTSTGRSTSCRAARRDETFSHHVRLLTQAWAERRVVVARLRAGAATRPRPAPRTRPRPAVPDRAVAPDPRPVPDRLGRDPRRDADVQDRADPRRVADARLVRAAGGRASTGCSSGPGTSSRTRSRSRSSSASSPTVASRVREARWHPSRAGRRARPTAR